MGNSALLAPAWNGRGKSMVNGVITLHSEVD
jgi:hypothetical protein